MRLGTRAVVLCFGCHRCYDVGRTDVNNVGVAMDIIIQVVEAKHPHCLAFEK